MTHLLLASIAGSFARHVAKSVKTRNALFITTAANVYESVPWMEEDIAAFEKEDFKVARMDFAKLTHEEIISTLSNTQLCIVGGGNTIYLLEEMVKKDLLGAVKKRVEEGMVYVGSSAGAVIAGPDVSLEQFFEDRKDPPPTLESYKALNLCNFTVFPHWRSDYFRKEYSDAWKPAYDLKIPIVTLTDSQAAEVVDGKMEIISR